MSGSILLFVLPAQIFRASANEAHWLDDYGAALRRAKFQRLPLLVVIEDPNDKESRIEQIRYAADQTECDLFNNYKLCRDGVPTTYGKAVADAFKAERLPHTSIIHNTASVQNLIKAGSFTTDGWTNALANHKEGRHRSEVSATRERFGGRGGICFT